MTPEEIKALQKKMDEAADAMKHAQEKHNTAIEGKIDALDLASMKDAAAASAKAFEEAQTERLAYEAENKERVEGLIKAVAGMGKKDAAEGLDPEFKAEMTRYYRKGILPSSDCVKAISTELAEHTMIHGSDEAKAACQKALAEGSNADGGFWVLPDRSTSKVDREFETSPMRSLATIVTTTSNSFEMIIDDDEAASGWVGEVEARAVTDTPEIGLLTIPVHEMYAKPQATQNMIDDAGFDIEGWLQGKVNDHFTRTSNTAFVTGNGSKKPKGIMAYTAATTPNTYQRDTVTQITATGTANTLDEPDDLIILQNSVLDSYQAGAVFVGNRATFTDIMVMQDGAGQYLMNPMMMKEGTDRILLRKPFVIFSDMADVATAALPLAYGDFRKSYTIVDRMGIRILRDPYSNKPYVQYYSTQRLGAAVSNFEGFHILVIN
jgi:HK97 family phage major capsid protein